MLMRLRRGDTAARVTVGRPANCMTVDSTKTYRVYIDRQLIRRILPEQLILMSHKSITVPMTQLNIL